MPRRVRAGVGRLSLDPPNELAFRPLDGAGRAFKTPSSSVDPLAQLSLGDREEVTSCAGSQQDYGGVDPVIVIPEVASQFPGEFARAWLRLRGMLCGDHLLGVRRGLWSGVIAELAA
jgi:hypothetical protein